MKRERTHRWTKHSTQRMSQRGVEATALDFVLDYGRLVHTRGAVIFAVGRKEIAFYAERGIDLSRLNGLQVVCCPLSGEVITVYRNRRFRGLRANLGRRTGCSKRHTRVARYLSRLARRPSR